MVLKLASLSSMPAAGIIVIVIIGILFALSVIVLFSVYARYRYITRQISGTLDQDNRMLRYTVNQFAESYRRYGKETNTPAIIDEAVRTKLSGALLCERYLNNAVSLFVTLGLFGTFMGLSLSVGSLTKLISGGNAEEWLSVLNSVGGGLMSALSGMGVAFYTSLVGVACSILLTILRAIFSPAAARDLMEARMELWLDQSVAPTLPTVAVNAKGGSAEATYETVKALNSATEAMKAVLNDATASLRSSLIGFNKTVEGFNGSVRDFNEFNYNLRGTVERMDLAARDFGAAVRSASAKIREE